MWQLYGGGRVPANVISQKTIVNRNFICYKGLEDGLLTWNLIC